MIGWVGVLLRLAWYAERRPLWLDEAMLAQSIIGKPFRALVSTPLGDAQVAPIGFLALERVAVTALGPGELALRLVPVLAAVVSVFLFLAVARRTLPVAAVPAAMALFAANRALVAYGAEAKQYSTDVAVALGVWALWLVVRARGTSWGGVAAVAVLGAIAVWLSQPAVLVLAGLWGATLVLDGWTERRRMSAAAVVWGASGAAAAWVAWQRVAPSDRAYLRTFWSAGFPSGGLAGLAWPVTAPAAALGSLLHVPPGVVWLALAGGGLWIAIRAEQRPLLLGIGPVLATFGAAAIGLYPFADRLVLFLLPVALLLVAIALVSRRRVGVVLAVCVLAPQVVLALRPWDAQHREDMRSIATAVAAEREPGDAVYVYYGGGPAFAYYVHYGAHDAQTDVPFDLGGCHRGDWRAYLSELDRYRGRRLWLVVGHATLQEDSLLSSYLGSTRATLATVTASDAFARLYAPDTGSTPVVAHPLLVTPRRGLTCRK